MLRSLALWTACVGFAACAAACSGTNGTQSSSSGSGATGGSSSSGPGSPDMTVVANPQSVCSAIVTFTVKGATTAHVVATGGSDHLTTPTIELDGKGQGKISVLGLAAETTYELTVNAQVGGKARSLGPVSFETGPLPAEIQAARMEISPVGGTPSSTDYYLIAGANSDTFAFDGQGVIRWYRRFGGDTNDAQLQPDSTYTTFVGTSMGWQPVQSEFVRYAPDGTQIATYSAISPDTSETGMPAVYSDDHDFHITTDANGADHFHYIGYEMRPLSATNTTLAAWHVFQRQSAAGKLEFEWKTWSRFTSIDNVEPPPGPGAEDVDHMNALSIDPTDGNYIVSLRQMDAVLKVDYNTGDVLWQIGGKQSNMTVMNDPLNGFYGQHYAHVLPNGNLLMLDNGTKHSPPQSRAAEYKLDTTSKTATLVWEYRRNPAIFTPVVGSANRLSNGNTLVAFCTLGVIDEVDATGKLLWEGRLEANGSAFLCYRAVPLHSLYAYQPL